MHQWISILILKSSIASLIVWHTLYLVKLNAQKNIYNPSAIFPLYQEQTLYTPNKAYNLPQKLFLGEILIFFQTLNNLFFSFFYCWWHRKMVIGVIFNDSKFLNCFLFVDYIKILSIVCLCCLRNDCGELENQKFRYCWNLQNMIYTWLIFGKKSLIKS